MDNLRRYDLLAPLYDLLDLAEYQFKRRLRPRLFAGLSGRILDAGVGTGRNMPFYPDGAEVVGFDLSPGMLARARVRARHLGRPVGLAAMDATCTGFADDSFDAVVSSFMFCVLDSELQAPALAELGRICKPGGEIRILDYTTSGRPFGRLYIAMTRLWAGPLYGAAFDRHTERYVAPAGLGLVRQEWLFQDIVRMLVLAPQRG